MYFRLRAVQRKREREAIMLVEKRFFHRVMRFFTFYDVFNRLELTFRGGAQIKEEKHLPRFGPIWTGFRERRRRATARRASRSRAPWGDGVLSLQRQQFPSTFPLFNYTAARPSAFATRDALDEAPLALSRGLSLLSLPPSIRSIFAVPLLRRLRVSRVVFTLRYVPRP